MKKYIVIFMMLITSCGSIQLPSDFNKIENCTPVVFEIFQEVAMILLKGGANWEKQIDGLIVKYGYDVIVCAMQSILDEWFDVREQEVTNEKRKKDGLSSQDFANGLDKAKYWLKKQQVLCTKVN